MSTPSLTDSGNVNYISDALRKRTGFSVYLIDTQSAEKIQRLEYVLRIHINTKFTIFVNTLIARIIFSVNPWYAVGMPNSQFSVNPWYAVGMPNSQFSVNPWYAVGMPNSQFSVNP